MECGIGNPITPGTGVKIQQELDYQSASWLRFARYYNARGSGRPEAAGVKGNGQLGVVWRSNIDKHFYPDISSAYTSAAMTLPNGALQYFAPNGNELLGISSNKGRLGTDNVYLSDSGVDQFDEEGRLILTSTVSGQIIRIKYSDGTSGPGGGYIVDASGNATDQVLPAGVAIRVEDAVGRSIAFDYDINLLLVKMTVPGESHYLYSYDAHHNLISVRYPDGRTRSYHYGESQHTGGADLPNALTGITDENGVRYVNYSYDSSGRAVGEVYPAVGNDTNRYQLSYSTNKTVVTDPLGTARTYNFQTIQGVTRSMGTDQPGGSGCGASSSGMTYDTSGNVMSRTDFNGHRTAYTYDSGGRNLEVQRQEGLNSDGSLRPETRTISTQWHDYWRRPVKVAEPKKLTTYVYHGEIDPTTGAVLACAPAEATLPGLSGGTVPIGVLCKQIEQATTDATGAAGLNPTTSGSARTWKWTYDARGQVLTADGPRTDVADITTYTYYDADDADLGKRGQLATITNALGHLTRISAYDAHGNPLTLIDPNGVETRLTYDARQRLASRTTGGETTSYQYDGIGQLTRLTLPDGQYLAYTWDGAHRQTGITDGLSNSVHYTLNAMGNRIREEVKDPQGQLTGLKRREYDALNRLFKEIGAQNQATQYGYDANGNRTQVTNPLNQTTLSAFDALDRLIQLTDPSNGQTWFAYDGQNRLTQVTDPRNLVTAYTVDGLGNLHQQRSPDTGTTLNTHDAAGNEHTRTDARGQTTTTQYDALNRPTQITYHDGSQIQYTWDTGTNGKGRLAKIKEFANGALASTYQYGYDRLGRITQESRTVEGLTHAQGYIYNQGRLTGHTLPSGRQVTYTHNTGGQIIQVSLSGIAPNAGQSQIIAHAITYHPFGAVKSWVDSAGQSHVRQQDQDGQISSYALGSTSWTLSYDNAGRITGQIDGSNASHSGLYGYDPLERLTSATLPGVSYGYSYDATGNRTTQTIGGTTYTYITSASSNRLQSIDGTPAKSYTHDASGNVTHDGTNQYSYDARGRLAQSTGIAGNVNYRINALGQRIQKQSPTENTWYHYDQAGRLVAESNAEGQIIKEYLWLEDLPLAVIQ
jgi:YD repeat-containing protein